MSCPPSLLSSSDWRERTQRQGRKRGQASVSGPRGFVIVACNTDTSLRNHIAHSHSVSCGFKSCNNVKHLYLVISMTVKCYCNKLIH